MWAWWDPRLDPRLPPSEWEREGRRRRRIVAAAGLLVLALIVLGGYVYAATRDRTRGMEPEEVARAAGMALAKAPFYRFAVHLSGDSPEGFFPAARVTGEYQRKPLLLHVKGEAGSGETAVPLEYYLEEETLYLLDPRSGGWVRVENPYLDELEAFQPANLAAPMIAGVRSARAVGRERLQGREALLLELEIDPAVMRIQPLPEWERIDYRLWVHTGSLRPVLFKIEVTYKTPEGGDGAGAAGEQRPGAEGAGDEAGVGDAIRKPGFLYQIGWEFERRGRLRVPPEIKKAAVVP